MDAVFEGEDEKESEVDHSDLLLPDNERIPEWHGGPWTWRDAGVTWEEVGPDRDDPPRFLVERPAMCAGSEEWLVARYADLPIDMVRRMAKDGDKDARAMMREERFWVELEAEEEENQRSGIGWVN